MVDRQSQVAQFIAVDQMTIMCDCGELETMFYCTKGCQVNGKPQILYCPKCLKKYHNHAPEFISEINQSSGAEWSKSIFEPLEGLYPLAKVIWEDLHEFIIFCEEENQKLPEQLKYRQRQVVSTDFIFLEKLFKEVIEDLKPIIEPWIAKIQLDELIKREPQRKQYEEHITYLIYLRDVNFKWILGRYCNVFLHRAQGPFDKYSHKTLLRLLKAKDCAYKMLITTPQASSDPQSVVPHKEPAYSQMIQINYDALSIIDQKHENQISGIEQQLDQNRELYRQQEHKIKLQQNQINNLQSEISTLTTTFQNQIEELINQKAQENQSLRNELIALIQNLKNQEIVQMNNKLTDQNIQMNYQNNQIQSDVRLLEKQVYALKIVTLENKLELIKSVKLDCNDYIRSILQLQNNKLIFGNTNDKKLKVFDQSTLQLTNTINVQGCGDRLMSVLEHQGMIIFIDGYYHTHMINESNNTLVTSHTDPNSICKYCMEIVDDITLIQGGDYGYLQLYDISDNQITLKYNQKLLTNYICQIKRIGNTNQFVVRESSKGMKVLQVTRYECQLQYTLMGDNYFTAMTLLTDNLILTQSNNNYYVFDIEQRAPLYQFSGNSQSYELCVVPGFDINNFPFVISREQEAIVIIHVKNKLAKKLYVTEKSQEWRSGGDKIVFLRDQEFTFITFGVTGEVLLFKLNKEWMNVLRI